ncbi:hypothetical protein AB2N04_10245 [Nitratireductor sp. GISD-1A_MAKvit]|uniref:hypothetical protein n=1 Tax=Nitratireductor sp. GISD-1A_MAKvit TaxID=3234198 RepID=UPI003465B4DF
MVRDGLMALDSAVPGGRPGTAVVYTTGQGFQVSLKAPSAFSTSPGGAGPITFWTKYRIAGATTGSEIPGKMKTLLRAGANQLSVDLRAMTDHVVFGQGDYEAYVTLTCE